MSRAVNECPKCKRLAMPDAPGELIQRMYDGICVECWRAEHPGQGLPEVPSQEFFPPTAIGQSKLFKKRLFDIYDMEFAKASKPRSAR